MDPRLRHVFIAEIGEHCRFARIAAAGIDAAQQDIDAAPDSEARDHAMDALWFNLGALLNAAASISRHLWPATGRKHAAAFADRGETLRTALDVTDASPLARRALRNHFEHADERLEQWWQTDPDRTFAHRVLGSPAQLPQITTPLAWYDPSTATVSFFDDAFSVHSLVEAITAIEVHCSLLEHRGDHDA